MTHLEDDNHDVTIPYLIRAQRLMLGLTQKQVGEFLGYKDRTAQTLVAQFESGIKPIPRAKLRTLAQTLGLDVQDLIPKDEEENMEAHEIQELHDCKRYLNYLADWVKTHSNSPEYGVSPARFEAWQQMDEGTA